MSADASTTGRRVVLFLCTGNYYRSRFAEALFNHLAARAGLAGYVATSRGLRIDPTGRKNAGPVSEHTIAATAARGVPLDGRPPQTLTYGDLRAATLIVAVKESEHRVMLDANFPGWSQRAIFWHVHDVDLAGPDVALAEIEQHVVKLVDDLKKLGD